MSKPRGQVFVTDTTPTMRNKGVKVAWRGIIHDKREVWGGQPKVSRSLAFKEMQRANKRLELGAVLAKPLPDDRPV